MGASVVLKVDGLDVSGIVGNSISEAFSPRELLELGVGVSDNIFVPLGKSEFGACVGS